MLIKKHNIHIFITWSTTGVCTSTKGGGGSGMGSWMFWLSFNVSVDSITVESVLLNLTELIEETAIGDLYFQSVETLLGSSKLPLPQAW